MRLDDEVIVVTGGGTGIGAAYARALGAAGATVVIGDIDATGAEQVAASVRAAGGVATAVHCDVRDEASAHALVARSVDEHGRITGLCNNAGCMLPNLLVDASAGDLREMFEVNVLGTFHCAQAALPHLLAAGRGSIVNVTSGAQTGQVANSGYGATKGAVATLTYAWAAELAGTGVRVNAISPMANSPMSLVMERYQQARGIDFHASSLPDPEANAPVAVFLFSEQAAGVHGQVVRIDGTRLSIMCHPAVRAPVLERDRWTPDDVADAFAHTLGALAVPVDVARYDITRVW